MNPVFTTIQARGQITLPLKYREKLGLKAGEQIKLTLEGEKIVAQPVTTQPALIIPAKYSPEESLKRLEKFTKSSKVYWTEEDDKYLAKLSEKDNKYLDW